ncbi:MAG: efflux RND transporter periplasmic adaptor subunit [Saprospiraceae bacterium]|nr:efflux RND transporter periplasmic adaptor subunit [Saprospiraceae bacterium]
MKQLVAFVLFLIMLQACEKGAKPAASPPSGGASLTVAAVEGYIAKATQLAESVTAAGAIVPAEETELHPEASGRVVRLNLPEGRTVQKGDLLLKIFDEDLQAQYRKLETQLKQAEITEQRLGELLKVKGVSQQEYDLAVLSVQTLKTDMELVRINIAKTELRAPYTGIIGLRRLSPGAYVTPATVVTTIRANAGLKLDFSIPEKYSQLIRVGQNVEFKVEGSASTHNATVVATEQTISSDARNLLVRALVRDSHGLLPGAFAEVSLTLNNKPQALMIPNQAVIPQARDKKVIVTKGGKAQFITVKTGVRQSGMIEITDGIQPGDTVCTTGVLFLRPDSPVKFSKVE